jgi:hypothetical protein
MVQSPKRGVETSQISPYSCGKIGVPLLNGLIRGMAKKWRTDP